MRYCPIILVLLLISPALAQKKLVVNVHEFEPMVIKHGDTWTGFDIELWDAIAKTNGWEYEIQETAFPDIFVNLRDGKADAGLSGITINKKREESIDFSHSYYDSGLKIAIRKGDAEYDLRDMHYLKLFVTSLLNPALLEIGLFLVLFILVAAHVVWAAERGTAHLEGASINDNYWTGIWQSIYFCTVTTSTVGYGDFTARRIAGRIVVLMLIIFGIAVFANFTAILSADYTFDKLSYNVNSLEDLRGKTVATRAETTSVPVIEEAGGEVFATETLREAFLSLEAGRVDAVVFDAPAVDFYVKNGDNLVVVPGVFKPQDYGIALQTNSDLRESINQSLLEIQESGRYKELRERWFGAQ